MAKMIELDLDPDERTLRHFGFIALGGFALVAALAWFEKLVFAFGLGAARPWVAGGCLAVGVLAALTSLVHPRANRPLFVGLSIAAFPIGFALSYLIMGTLFFVVITPIGLVLRLFGQDPMLRRFEPDAASYWADCHPARPAERYFKQF